MEVSWQDEEPGQDTGSEEDEEKEQQLVNQTGMSPSSVFMSRFSNEIISCH